MKKQDPFEYIRDYYRVPAQKWGIVKFDGKYGVITGVSGPHLKVRVEGGFEQICHPKWKMEYLTGEISKEYQQEDKCQS